MDDGTAMQEATWHEGEALNVVSKRLFKRNSRFPPYLLLGIGLFAVGIWPALDVRARPWPVSIIALFGPTLLIWLGPSWVRGFVGKLPDEERSLMPLLDPGQPVWLVRMDVEQYGITTGSDIGFVWITDGAHFKGHRTTFDFDVLHVKEGMGPVVEIDKDIRLLFDVYRGPDLAKAKDLMAALGALRDIENARILTPLSVDPLVKLPQTKKYPQFTPALGILVLGAILGYLISPLVFAGATVLALVWIVANEPDKELPKKLERIASRSRP